MNQQITKQLRSQILRCHKEGWVPANIASICRVKPDVVINVLKDANITD